MQIAPHPISDFIPFAALQAELPHAPSPLRKTITSVYRREERAAVQWLLGQLKTGHAATPKIDFQIQTLARKLVTAVREKRTRASGVDALMHEFSLSSEEGVALMCLAEALLRIPDNQTADRLIADKISKGDWSKHLGESPSLFVNAATWGLMITGKLVGTNSENGLGAALTKLISKGGEPLIRKGVDLAMRLLGNQFVTGQTIAEALRNSRDNEERGYRYSYDMLGEAALTDADAARYYTAYEQAIHAIGNAAKGQGIKQGPGISIKLSALHPRYSRAQRGRVMEQLLPCLKKLTMLAKHYDIGLNIDAEEADRLELSLDLMEALAFDPDLAGFDGIGFVVQAYQKRCPYVIDFLIDLAHRSGRRFMVRLVKGAYWDSEIKRAQVDGLSGYPVYTRKVYTDISYLVCAQKLLAANQVIYPQFATHNALTLATIQTWAAQDGITDYEFQCLHGMGEALYDQVVGKQNLNQPCRIYAPVGSHETLLAYLVRRLLENGANSSFVNQIVDADVSIDQLITDPIRLAQQLAGSSHNGIVLPVELFGNERKNSAGLDFSNEQTLAELSARFLDLNHQPWNARPLLADGPTERLAGQVEPTVRPITNPAHHSQIIGHVQEAQPEDVEQALAAAQAYAIDWQTTLPAIRAQALFDAANLFEQCKTELMYLAVREAGKSLPNAIAEVREAVDFLRYYAAQVANHPNTLGLGPVACISPWNFPLAIFVGECAAALAAGNVVLAKPAEQTPLIAFRAVELMHSAGIPAGALQLLPGTGETVGASLVADARIKGVIFTGSTEVAHSINRTLAHRMVHEGIDIPLIAETGGQNALIVDSSALPEQVVQDVLISAFDSAGQRCSALRVLFLQTDIAEKTLTMLKGAMQELRIGNPDRLSTDIGPVIDAQAQQKLLQHIVRFTIQTSSRAHRPYNLPLSDELKATLNEGTFVAPTILEIGSLNELTQEVFGPVLHVIRYQRDQLGQVIESINASGYGLTLGIHSRIDETIDFITERAHVGNIYVNRNIVGAVVGVQPFGGEGLSGTGPKAGGPLYVKRLQRNPSMTMGGHIIHERRSLPVLDALINWAKSHGHQRLIAQAEHYLHISLLGSTLALPGPTGERNTLSFAARGNILCAATKIDSLLDQLAAVFATGNFAIVLAHPENLIPPSLPEVVRAMIQVVENLNAVSAPFQIALVETNLCHKLHPLLAARDGALVSLIETGDGGNQIPLWRLLAERALCVNTTAAGGNASLMTLDA